MSILKDFDFILWMNESCLLSLLLDGLNDEPIIKLDFRQIFLFPGVSNRWKSMIGKAIDQSIKLVN